MTDVQSKLGTLFRNARVKKGWSLRMVERQTGIPHTWVRNLETGHYNNPAPDRLALLADLYGIPLKAVDRLARGGLAQRMPALRLYLRAKYDLTSEEVDQVEDCLRAVYQERERQGEAEEDEAA